MKSELKSLVTCSTTHEAKIFALCKFDNTYICEECYQKFHRGHLVEYLKFIAKDHLNFLKNLEEQIPLAINSCVILKENNTKSYVLKNTINKIRVYYEDIIESIRTACERKVTFVTNSLSESFEYIERLNKELEAKREELSIILMQIRQQQKNCENLIKVKQFKHLRSNLVKSKDTYQRLQQTMQHIENINKHLHDINPNITFNITPEDICSSIDQGVVIQNSKSKELPLNIKKSTVIGTDDVKLFKVLSMKKTPEPAKKYKRSERRSRSKVSSNFKGTLTRKLTEDIKQHNVKIFYIDTMNKLLYLYYPDIRKRSIVPLMYNKSFPEGFGLAEIGNGNLVMSGGEHKSNVLKTVYEINVQAKKLIELNSMILPRRDHGFIGVKGFLVAIGGSNEKSKALKHCEKYSIVENNWSELPELNESRNLLSPCVFSNRYLYAIGGSLSEHGKNETYEFLDIELPLRWVRLRIAVGGKEDTSIKLLGVGVAQISDTEILVFGGLTKNDYSNSSWILNVDTGILTSTGTFMKSKDAFCQRQSVFWDNHLYCYGYWSKYIYMFNIETFKWSIISLS